MRSYLFVPGNRPERFSKALKANADVVILDLEDAVADGDKAQARQNITEAIAAGAQVYVRINAFGSPWFADDLALLGDSAVQGVMLPKAEYAEAFEAIAKVTDAPIIALVETALGVWNALAVAKSPNVQRIAFGSVDYQVDIGSDGSDEALLYARSQLVLASRVAGIQPPLDGVSVQLDDVAVIELETAQSKALGFAGKLCIHPKQVPIVNRVFLPSAEEVNWAHAVVEASEKSGSGAVSVNGAMVDLPVLLKAQRILASL